MGERETTDELEDARLDLSLDNALLYLEYRRLADEQTASRRLSTLVARGVKPSEVFDAVVQEMRRCLNVPAAGLWRYESSDEITLMGAANEPTALAQWPVGARTPIDGNTLATIVQRSCRRLHRQAGVADSIIEAGWCSSARES